MSTAKHNTRAKSPQWWKHLRDWKRLFWKRERKAHNKEIRNA
jgi:hypothetical protein